MRCLAVVALVLSVVTSACRAPAGETVEARRFDALRMRDNTLTELYAQQPYAQKHIENAPGYAVFSNIGSKIFVLATGNGYGVVTDNETGETTHMRMIEAGGGIGLGVKTYRAVYVFNDAYAMKDFILSGWQARGDADAALKHEDEGADATIGLTSDELAKPVSVYQFTESGIALSAVATGAKFYVDKELN